MAEAECRRAADTAEAAYRSAFNRGLPAEEGRLDAEHARCMALAASTFASSAIGEPAVKEVRSLLAAWHSRPPRLPRLSGNSYAEEARRRGAITAMPSTEACMHTGYRQLGRLFCPAAPYGVPGKCSALARTLRARPAGFSMKAVQTLTHNP